MVQQANCICVENIVLYVVKGSQFANGDVTFRRVDFTGPEVKVLVTVKIDSETTVSALRNMLVTEARDQLDFVGKLSKEEIDRALIEGSRGYGDSE